MAKKPEKKNTPPLKLVKPDVVEWPASKVEMWPINKIKPHPDNAKTHPPEQLEALAADMREDGVTTACLVDEGGVLIYGEGRWRAAKLNDWTEYPVMIARGWSEEKKRAVRIKDNTRPLMGGWDEAKLKIEVSALKLSGYELPKLALELTGIKLDLDGGSLPDNGDRGKLLELVNVTIGEPKHKVENGAHYLLSGRHHLVCMSVVADWPTWGPLLADGSLFAPYPGIFVPFAAKAKAHNIVMVQPDAYTAGHILDRYAEVHGKKSIKEIK